MRQFSLNLATAPSEEPVTVAEAKAHLRIVSDDTSQDTYIDSLITAARIYAQNFTKRALITQTWDMFFRSFYDCEKMEVTIPLPPLQSVSFVKYYDSTNTLQTLDTSLYEVDTYRKPGRVYPAYGQYWPATLLKNNACNIRFVAGYGAAAAVPKTIKQAMLIMIGHWFENREPVVVGSIVTNVPKTADDLLWSERVQEF